MWTTEIGSKAKGEKKQNPQNLKPLRNTIARCSIRLVGGVSTHLKNMLVKLDHFLKDRDENKKFFETTTQKKNE